MANSFMDPKTVALLNLGAGLMQAGAPSYGPPKSFLGALGGAAPGALNSMFMAQQQNDMAAYRKQQLADMQRQANAPAPLMNVAPGGTLVDPSTRQPVFTAPTAPRGPLVVGDALIDPANPSQPLYKAPPKPQAPTPLAQLLAEREALPQGDPRRATYDAAIGKATTAQALVNVDNRQEGAFGKEVGTELGKQYSSLMAADFAAPATIGKYDRLGSLLTASGSGKFKGATTDIKAAAKGLGIDLAAMGVKDDVDSAQAARALSNQLALELRNPAGGAGMPGAMSDKDREFLVQSIPSLENDPNAVGKMIEYRKKLAQREQQVAKKAREYRRKNGKFDEGFFDELQQWSNDNPLFPAPKEAPSVAPDTGGWSIKPKGG